MLGLSGYSDEILAVLDEGSLGFDHGTMLSEPVLVGFDLRVRRRAEALGKGGVG